MNAKLSAPSLLPRTPRATVMQLLLALSLAPLAFGLAVPATAPVVTIAQGTYSGKTNATSGIRSFLGMPYAQSPVGQLRFALPVAPYNTNNTFVNDASKYGPSCSQQATTTASTGASVNQSLLLETIKAMPFFAPASSESEDCLSINVIAPPASTKLLPVLVVSRRKIFPRTADPSQWIYGGGFEFGTTSGSDGTPSAYLKRWRLVGSKELTFRSSRSAIDDYRLAHCLRLAQLPIERYVPTLACLQS